MSDTETREIKQIWTGKRDWLGGAYGTVTRIVVCPFCGREVEVWVRSFAAVGKRCACGAKLDDYGSATRTEKKR